MQVLDAIVRGLQASNTLLLLFCRFPAVIVLLFPFFPVLILICTPLPRKDSIKQTNNFTFNETIHSLQRVE